MRVPYLPKPELKFLFFSFFLLFLFSLLPAQEKRIISGILKDDAGDPVPGANIIIKGTNQGVITDINGYYSIEAPVGSTLVISFIGYGTHEVYVAPVDKDVPERLKSKKGRVLPADSLPKPSKPKVFHHTIPSSEKTLSPYFFVQSDDPAIDRMPLKSTSVNVSVSGVIADVKVKQLYINEGKNSLEAVYIFPGSTRAAVYGMSMKIGDRLLKAKIREKQQARMEYETARQEGKTATLLEQQRPNVFQMNVANILPGDSIEVELNYTEILESLDGIYEFVYPTVVGPRYSETPDNPQNSNEKWVENPYLHQGETPNYKFDLQVKLNAGMPIQKIFSPSHLTNIVYQDKDKALITLNEQEHQGGNSDFILRYGLRGGKVESGILLHENGDEQFFLLMMEPPVAPEPKDIPDREYIFIMDVSGSMNGFPLDISKSAMLELLGKLKETDKFNILTFAGGNSLMWNRSRVASPENIAEAANFTNLQSGGGGTRLLDALNRALNLTPEEGYSRSFVVMTDGYVDVEKESFNLVRNNLGKANLFALGIGTSVNRYLIEGLAHAGMGEKFIATSPEEGKRVAGKMMDYIEKPVLTNISVDFGNFNAYDYDPVAIPDVFAQRPILIYGKYSGSADGVIKIKGRSGNQPYLKTFNLREASRENNQALRYLWARNKVRYLDDYDQYYTSSYQNDSKPAKSVDQINAITQLGLKYNILTQYTSFIAVDSMIRNKDKNLITVKQPLPLPKGVSDLAVGNENSRSASSTISGNDLNLSLTPDISSLDEVVVTGYGIVKKSDLTSSIAHVNTEEISGNKNIQQVLQGRIPGIQVVNNSGAPGSNASVRIRCASTLMGNQQPLYIVDGIPVVGNEDPAVSPVLNIDPASINSIEVLKDASATAIYGSRAAAGVILINTKKGDFGKSKITFSTGTGRTKIATHPHSESLKNYWYNDLLRNGNTNDMQLGISGRKPNFQYATHLGGFSEKGILKNSDLHKMNATFQFTWNLFHGQMETGINGLTGLAKLHNFSMIADSNKYLSAIPSNRNIYNLDGRFFVKMKLPVNGLVFRSEISSTHDIREIHLDNNITPISFYTILNDNVYLNNTQLNTEIEYTGKIFSQGDILLSGHYIINNINNKYNYQEDRMLETIYPVRGITQQFRIHSVVLMAEYSLKDRYKFRTSIAEDKSGRFPKGHQHITQPSFSFVWNLGRENFIQPRNYISNLKIRYNIGLIGNGQLPFYPVSTLVNELGNTDVPLLTENRDLTWEKNNRQNLGMDLGFWQDKLLITLDFFRNKTFDMYYLSEIETDTPVYEWLNAGDFINRGIDFGIHTRLLNRNGLIMNGYMNLSVNRSRITKITAGNGNLKLETFDGLITGQNLKVGDPLGVYYGLKIKKIDMINHEIIYEDISNNGSVGMEDLQRIVDTNPDYYGGFGLQAKCRNLEFNAGLTFVFGNQVINTFRNLDKYQAFTTNKSFDEDVLSGLNVENGSYLRLSELSMGYNFPKDWFSKAGISQVKVSVMANNLLTFTRYSGQDPEFNNYYFSERKMAKVLPGIDRNFYPVSRSFTMRLEIGF